MTPWEAAGSGVWRNEELGLPYVIPDGGGFFRVRVRGPDEAMVAMRVNLYAPERGSWPKFVKLLPEAVRDRVGPAFIELEDLAEQSRAEALSQLAKQPPKFERAEDIVDLWKQGHAENMLHTAADILVAGQELQKDALIMAFISQSLPRDLWIPLMLTGPTRQGKSFTATTMGEHLLREYFLSFTSHSPLFMAYMTRDDPHFYRHYVLYIDDLTHDPERLNSVRIFSDRTSKNPMHGTVIDGQPVSINADPPPLLLTSTVEAPKDPTIRGRFLIIPIDESKLQDDVVFERQLEEAALRKRVDRYSEKVNQAARVLDHIRHAKLDIRNLLGGAFREPRQKGKETFPLLDGLTRSYTLLRVWERPSLGSAWLTTWEDVRDALTLWFRWEGAQDRPPGRIHAFVDHFGRGEALTKDQAVKRSGLANYTVYEYLRDAVHYGLLERVEGNPPRYRPPKETDEILLVDSVETRVRWALEHIEEDAVRDLLKEIAEEQRAEPTGKEMQSLLQRLLPPGDVLDEGPIGW